MDTANGGHLLDSHPEVRGEPSQVGGRPLKFGKGRPVAREPAGGDGSADSVRTPPSQGPAGGAASSHQLLGISSPAGPTLAAPVFASYADRAARPEQGAWGQAERESLALGMRKAWGRVLVGQQGPSAGGREGLSVPAKEA